MRLLRNSDIFLLCMLLGLVLVSLLFVHSHVQSKANFALLEQKARVVKNLELTDLCLFTEAAYTRHPTLADRHTPFQDHPMSLEHFPAGALLLPPATVRTSP